MSAKGRRLVMGVQEEAARGVLRDAHCWLITAGKAGMLTQLNGLSAALGVKPKLKLVDPSGIWRMLAPWGPVAPGERFGVPGTTFAPPWPDIAIACGRASIPYVRRLRRCAGSQCFTVILQDPRTNRDAADLIWVPAHDKRRGANVITSVLSPHDFDAAAIAARRAEAVPAIDALPGPRVAVFLGGRTGIYRFSAEDDRRFEAALGQMAAQGASFLISSSRRTHPELLAAVERATAGAPRVIWRGKQDGENPFTDFLAKADWFVVTADSVNMTGEACVTGRPIYVFHPSGGSTKFANYHQSLEELGATRALSPAFAELEAWHYEPLNATPEIAHEIEKHVWRRRQLLGQDLDANPTPG